MRSAHKAKAPGPDPSDVILEIGEWGYHGWKLTMGRNFRRIGKGFIANHFTMMGYVVIRQSEFRDDRRCTDQRANRTVRESTIPSL